jgi:hypothetical protein
MLIHKMDGQFYSLLKESLDMCEALDNNISSTIASGASKYKQDSFKINVQSDTARFLTEYSAIYKPPPPFSFESLIENEVFFGLIYRLPRLLSMK